VIATIELIYRQGFVKEIALQYIAAHFRQGGGYGLIFHTLGHDLE
jgi:hypothetical protein